MVWERLVSGRYRSMEERIEQLKRQRDGLKEQRTKLREAMEALKKNAAERADETAQRKLAALEAKAASLLQQRGELLETIRQLEERRTARPASPRVEGLEAKLAALEIKNAALTKQRGELLEAIARNGKKAPTAAVANYQEQIQAIEARADALAKERDALLEATSHLEKRPPLEEVEGYQKQIEALEVRNAALAKQQAEAPAEKKPSAREIETYQKKIAALETRNAELTKELDAKTIALGSVDKKSGAREIEAFQKRLEGLKAREAALKNKIASVENSFVGNNKSERFEQFLSNTRLKLPQKGIEFFKHQCRALNTKERAEEFLTELEEQNYRPLYESLFAPEMDIARTFDYKSLRERYTFDRGATDIKTADLRNISMDERKLAGIAKVAKTFDGVFKLGNLDDAQAAAICEIGSAWGASTRYFLERFKPPTYHVYEIDSAYCEWLGANLAVDVKTCDGETLSETGDATMDLTVASSCLFFMPALKQWSYLQDMARVTRPGGLVFFNAMIYERLGPLIMDGVMKTQFPRREFGIIPQSFIDWSFPAAKWEHVVKPTTESLGYEIYRRKGGPKPEAPRRPVEPAAGSPQGA